MAPFGKTICSRIDMSLLKDADLNLRVLRYDGDYSRYIEDIWGIVGATLEEVHLPCVFDDENDDNSEWVQSMNQLKDHCGQLISIHLGRLGRYGFTEEGN